MWPDRRARRLGFAFSLAAFACVAAAGACREAAAPGAPVLIGRDTAALFQTSSLSYTLAGDEHGWSGQIAYAFTNRTQDSVSFVNCHGDTQLEIEKFDGGRWRTVWAPAMPLCLSPPRVVAPGESLMDTVSVQAAYPGQDWHPSATAEQLTGVHRIVWRDVVHGYRMPSEAASSFGTRLPLSQRVSNPFRLAVAARAALSSGDLAAPRYLGATISTIVLRPSRSDRTTHTVSPRIALS